MQISPRWWRFKDLMARLRALIKWFIWSAVKTSLLFARRHVSMDERWSVTPTLIKRCGFEWQVKTTPAPNIWCISASELRNQIEQYLGLWRDSCIICWVIALNPLVFVFIPTADVYPAVGPDVANYNKYCLSFLRVSAHICLSLCKPAFTMFYVQYTRSSHVIVLSCW